MKKRSKLSIKTLLTLFAGVFLLVLIAIALVFNAGVSLIIVFITTWCVLYAIVFRLDIFLALLLGFITYFAVNIAVYTLCSFLELSVERDLLIAVHSILSICVVAFLYWKKFQILQSFILTPPVVMAGMTFAVTLGAIIAPFIATGGLGSLQYLSIGEDNISHFALHNSIIENHSLLYTVSDSMAGVNHNLKAYPHGYHANLAANSMLVFGSNPSIPEITKSHILQISSFYALLIATMIYIVAASLFAQKKTTITRYILGVSVSVLLVYFCGFGFLLYLFTYGFHTQIASCLIILTILAASIPMIRTKAKTPIDRRWLMFIVLILAVLTTAYTWYFMLPVIALFGMAWVFVSWKFLLQNWKITTGSGLACALLSLVPIAYDTFRPHDSNGLLLPGAIWQPQPLVLVFVGFLVSLFLIIYLSTKKQARTTHETQLFTLLVSSAIFSTLIAMYMLININRLDYYFYKSEYTLLIIAIMTLGVTVGAVAERAEINVPKKAQIAAASVVLIFSVIFCSTLAPTSYANEYIKGTLPNALYSPYLQVSTKNKDEIYAIEPACKSFQNYITQRWIHAILLDETRGQTSLLLDHIYFRGEQSVESYKKLIQQPHTQGLASISCDPIQ